MIETIRWTPATLGDLATTAGAVLERGDAARRITSFSLASAAERGAGLQGLEQARLDRFSLVAVPAGAGAAALLAAASAAGAVALVEREQPVPAAMAVLRVPGLGDAVARMAAARRAASRARVIAVLGSAASTVVQPLAAACRRRWRTVSAGSPSALDTVLLGLVPSTERAVVVLEGGDLVSLVADMALAMPALVVVSPPRPGDAAPFEIAAALPASATLVVDESDPRAGLIRHSALCRVLSAGAVLGAPAAHSADALAVVPTRAAFACRGLGVTTSLPSSALPAARLAAAAALLAGTDALDIVEAFARLLPAAMPLPLAQGMPAGAAAGSALAPGSASAAVSDLARAV